jgi:CBS domain-containing protein
VRPKVNLEGGMKALKAKDIMNSDVLTVGPDWSMDRLADFLIENAISGVPVTSEAGKLLGIVSLTDIVRQQALPGKDEGWYRRSDYYLDELDHQYAMEELRSFRVASEPYVTVRDIMTRKIFSVNEDTAVQKVADAMIRGCIHRVFVTRDNKLVGIISSSDMLKIIRDL